MNKEKMKSVLLWALALVLMLGLAVYQRMTGPTHPVRGKITIKGETVKYKLLRSHDTGLDARIEITVPQGVTALFKYKRFKSYDEWTSVELQPENGKINAAIPFQPPAGKVEYQIALIDGEEAYPLTVDPIIIRFKGAVPDFALIPHIFFMFFAMVFSIRTGLEALLNRKKTYLYTSMTLIFLFIGGLILGPIVQKYAFDAYWTGWPWGTDLTDNKTIIAFIFWGLAWVMVYRNKKNRLFPIIAMVIMVAVYLIPHSLLGSEIDHTKQTQTTPKEAIK